MQGSKNNSWNLNVSRMARVNSDSYRICIFLQNQLK